MPQDIGTVNSAGLTFGGGALGRGAMSMKMISSFLTVPLGED